jgi:DNA polymerase
MERLLSDISQLLVRERELFGEDALSEPRASMSPSRPSAASPGRHTEPPPAEDLVLFDVPAATFTSAAEAWAGADSVASLNAMICTCVKCPLGQTRTKFVFGVGNPKATLMIIGEAPGAEEDAQGEPFVGRAGQLLNKILDAIGFRRDDVYICNILKCRPPNNRKPQL